MATVTMPMSVETVATGILVTKEVVAMTDVVGLTETQGTKDVPDMTEIQATTGEVDSTVGAVTTVKEVIVTGTTEAKDARLKEDNLVPTSDQVLKNLTTETEGLIFSKEEANQEAGHSRKTIG